MPAVLLPNAPAPGSSSGTPSPSQSSSSNPPPAPAQVVPTSAPPQHKSFRQMARAPLETLRTVTRSKGKNKVSASVESVLTANEADFKSSLGLASSTAKLHKNRDKTITSREKGKEKEPLPRASIDTTASVVVSEERGALRRLTSRTGLSFGRKSNDASAAAAPEPSTSRTSSRAARTGWPSFMQPSQSAGSMSTPTLHLNSDPNSNETHVNPPTTSVGALVSPSRPRRPSRDSGGGGASGSSTAAAAPTGSRKPPPSSPSARQNPPSPTTLILASSSKNTGTSNKKLPPSPSTPSLPSYGTDAPTAASPPRPIIRRSTEVQREPLPRSPPLPPPSSARGIIGRGERSASRSGGSASGSDSRSASPVTPPNSTGLGRAGGRRPSITYASISPTASPSPPPRRSSDRRPSFEQRTRPYGSISASHLPLGAAPSSIPGQHSPFRNGTASSRERHVPPPISTGHQPPPVSSSPSLYQQRRNSSSASFTRPSSPPSSSAQRTHSPVYKSHGRNTSTSSLAGGLSAISPQREAMRAAASFIVKEMSKPTPAALKANPPYGGLAGAPGGVKNDPWEEVERRLLPLARLERVWGRSGFAGSSSTNGMGTLGNASSASVDATGVSIGGMTVSSGGEERERRAFCEALRDGYVLAQLMNKLSPTSSLLIPLVDPREDGFSKTSNILKFREIAKEFIIKSGPEGKELIKEMFGKDDLAEGKIDGVTRVSRVIAILATLKDSSQQQQKRWISSKERREVSVARTSTEIDADSSMSGSGTITPGLGRSTVSIAQRISSPPPNNLSRSTAELGNDSPQSKLDRRHSMDKHRKVAASPSFATPPTPPPSRPPISERRSSGGHYQLGQVTSTSPPPAPPRSLLRNAPSFNSSNRASVASSAQTHATDHTNLFDPHGNHRSSNRFGTIRTMNTIATDATSIVPDGSVNGSWGREDANNAMAALGLVEHLDTADPAPVPPVRRRSYDLKSAQQSGIGLALQSHPPISSSELFQEGRPRRDRRSSEIAAATTDLTRVLEDPEKEGSIRPKGINRRSSDNKGGLNFGKAKWPEDFVGRFNAKAEASVSPYRPATPDLDEDPFLAVTSKERSLSPPERAPTVRDSDTTPKGKAPVNVTAPITIVTAASRQVTPSEEKDDPSSLSASKPNLPYRRPSHHSASQSVDVLLPRTDRRVSERRISIDRRPSAERALLLLKSEHMRESSSGSGESQTGVEAPPVRRPLRRASTRGHSQSRQAVYIPKRSSPSEDLSSSSVLLPAVASVPAVSHIRVPFPRTVSGEHQQPPQREAHKPRAAFPSESESTVRDYAPSPLPRDESLSRKGTANLRPRHQSDLEATRLTLTRRGSSNIAPNGTHRRTSHGAEDHNLAPRGRFDPSQNLGQGFASATNLARASSVASVKGSNMRRTIVVREEGKAPMHYQLGNCIGRGQFGSVYRALNINTGQIVAVKRIRLEGLPESEITQLMKEVDLLKRLHHPSIVQYEGMVRDDDSLDIVLEYVENGSLGQTLKAFGKFNEKLVATYVTKILEGLHYLHEQQVVHCDLKAANILSTKNGNIKLSDFGVSLTLNAMENAKETANNVAGTPNWMAPEVIELKGASTASDIWSLGCTVVELLTGKPPYSEIDNTLAVMFRIVEDDKAPIPDGCSETLRDFLSQCFKKDPDERPTAESLFEHPWLKRTWGLHKASVYSAPMHPWYSYTDCIFQELRPDDSVPFLRRISTDLQARQLSIQNLAEVARTQSTSPASPLTTSPGEPEFVVKPHSFVKTTFSKPVTCKVCQQSVKKSAVLCEECSLICHATCAKDASSHCDVRAQLLLYSQYAQGGLGNGSPRVASSSALPSPGPPPSPRPLELPLSGSPSVNNGKFFVPPWKRLSKASTPDANSVMGGADERGSQRRSGNFLFRRSEDRSRSRRDSMAGGSQNSASTRSAATRESQRSTSRMPGDLGQSRISTITFEAGPELPVPQSTPLQASMQLANDPTRRPRRSRKDSRTDSKDCVIQ